VYDKATQTLTGEIEDEDALAEAVDAGYYPDVSIGAKQRASDGRMYLHHLAYLGEEPPAIKDLAKTIKEDLGIAAADAAAGRVFPSPSEKRMYLSDTPTEKFLEGDIPTKSSKEAFSMDEKEAQKLREENERLKAENAKKDLAHSDADRRKQEADRERLKAAMDGAKVPQGVREKALRLSDALDGGKTIELSDAEAAEGKRSVSPLDCLIELVSAYPKPVETGAMNLSDGDGAAGPAAGQIDFFKI
jgi:hypothetical protein